VRTSLIALGLALAACGRTERVPAAAAPSAPPRRGPDLLVLRAPRAGGPVRVFDFPKLDSVLWTSTGKAPALERFLGFDPAAGAVLAEAPNGAVVRIDFRLGTVVPDQAPKLRGLASADGSAAFGVAPDGRIVRVTPSGAWSFKPPAPVRELLPQPDGQLLVLADRAGGAVLWSVRPPDSTVSDSAVLPVIARAISTPVGDRVYFTSDDRLLALRVRTLASSPEQKLPRRAAALLTTPSGDRLYVAPDSLPQLLVLDRYSGKLTATIALPAPASALRIDPLGRFLLARTGQDVAVVVAVGTDSVRGTVRTDWRADLPAVAPNGMLALVAGNDVVLMQPDSLRPLRTVSGGARDLWRFFAWNGFRPRAAELDEPVTFPEDTVVPHDSTSIFTLSPEDSARAADSARRAAAALAAATPSAPAPARDTAPKAPQFTVQFAALKTDSAARQVMKAIHVTGAAPRVVPNAHDGVITYRVVIGPFPTRDDAERVARTAGMSYWIYEGAP
jgi:cell division septation protein DedD